MQTLVVLILGFVGHILRLLATHHITREVRPDVFANNRLSSVMDSGKSWSELVSMEDGYVCGLVAQ